MLSIDKIIHGRRRWPLRKVIRYSNDYEIIKDVRTGFYSDGSRNTGLHVYAPTALLAVPLQIIPSLVTPSHLHPLFAIYICRLVYHRAHTNTSTSQWSAAKHKVQVDDAIVHETSEHFADTHLLMEFFLGYASQLSHRASGFQVSEMSFSRYGIY